MSARGFGVGLASVIGSFFVYGAHLACGGGRFSPRVVATAPAQTVASSAPSAAPSTSAPPDPKKTDCGCAAPRVEAFFAISGDEKIAIDPVDAQASLEVSYGRTTAGKKQIVLSGIVRAYRSDVAAERPTTLAIRIAYPEGATPSSSTSSSTVSTVAPTAASPKDVEVHLTTWGAGAVVAPRVYAAVAKSALTVSVTDTLVEIRGSLTLKDPPSGRSIVVDKLSLRKSGTALLPERNAVFHP